MQTPALMAQPNAAAREEAPNIIERVFRFNEIGQAVPPGQWHLERATFYTGMQCEEFAEKLQAIADGEVDTAARQRMSFLAQSLQDLGAEFKSGMHQGAVLRCDGEQMLDGDIDLAVVTLGCITYQTSKFRQAVGTVLGANDAKFPNGVAIRDANGKIMKPVGWSAPDLSRFIEKPRD